MISFLRKFTKLVFIILTAIPKHVYWFVLDAIEFLSEYTEDVRCDFKEFWRSL